VAGETPSLLRGSRSVRLRPTWGAIAVLAGGILAAIVARNVFVAAHRVLGWAVAATVVAVLLTPLVNLLDRRLPRALAYVVTFVSLAAVIVALGAAVFGDLRDQVDVIREEAPAAAARIEQRDDRLGELARDIGLEDSVVTFVRDLDVRLGTSGEAIAGAALSFPPYFVSAILTVFLMIFGERIVHGALGLLGDDARRRRVRRVVFEAVSRGRRYVLLAVSEAVVVGFTVWAGCHVLDVPAPMVLALLAAVVSLVPYLGVFLAWAPVLLLGLGFAPVRTVGVLAGAVIALQVLDVLWWRPLADQRTVHVGPLVPVVVGLLGFEIYGVGGALYAAAAGVFVLAAADAAATEDEPVPTPVDDWDGEAVAADD
jgi:putative heme transporter